MTHTVAPSRRTARDRGSDSRQARARAPQIRATCAFVNVGSSRSACDGAVVVSHV